jgi:hypothetical protein
MLGRWIAIGGFWSKGYAGSNPTRPSQIERLRALRPGSGGGGCWARRRATGARRRTRGWALPASIRGTAGTGRERGQRRTHLGSPCGGSGSGWVSPRWRAAWGHGNEGHAHAKGERGQERARRAPYHSGVLRRQLGAEDWRRQCGVAGAQELGRRRWLQSEGRCSGARPRGGKVGEVDAAEEERESAAAKKGEGLAASACGSTELPLLTGRWGPS